MNILLTGGAGYIGSHTYAELIAAGHYPVIFDNFSNSHSNVISRLGLITGKPVAVVSGDVRDPKKLQSALMDYACEIVIHFAGLKAVGESTLYPIDYYDNNVCGAISLLTAMNSVGVSKLIFSSSAAVYGPPTSDAPIPEDHPLSPVSPYGRTKHIIENLLHDWHLSHSAAAVVILRYFNPVGAHPSGLIGEDPNGTPNNLMPLIAQVAVGRRDYVNVFGDDYPTIDGTGVRDYIHVMDLAYGHVRAIKRLAHSRWTVLNLGTGHGHSVLEVIRAFEDTSGRPIPYSMAQRRSGDVATCFADPSQANRLLGWKAERTLHTMCADHWHWQQQNPCGYAESFLPITDT
jgi:UDP-glucose 4-epimerase